MKQQKASKQPYLVLALTACWLLLSACADRTRPAPVVNLSNKSGPQQQPIYESLERISGDSYKVQKGETLYSIAFRAGSDVKTLAKLNNITPPYKIYPNQLLIINNKATVTVAKGNLKKEKNPQVKSKKNVANDNAEEYGGDKGGKFSAVKVPSLKQQVKSWKWPVKGPVIATFSTAEKGNQGIDIAGKRGTPVKAAADGLVVYAGNALRGYGNLIIIKHNDDYLSAYAHNDQLLVKEQETVKAGSTIAKMGNTGTDREKLHFEIRFRGKSVNPLRYLPKR
ncbi:peptidoglycan DD-metalloendopeptidase family protein [Thalassotalea maritima]|uniref:peptidoglycan DD-metalloendopeptidase family protein n=1 Tax=Thalassotalea maritima TaxID=3242416 RepID=UPI00352900BF